MAWQIPISTTTTATIAVDLSSTDNVFVAAGALKASFFFSGGGAHDTDDHILCNHLAGALVYDANGAGAGQATLIAVLANKPPVLTASDFQVI